MRYERSSRGTSRSSPVFAEDAPVTLITSRKFQKIYPIYRQSTENRYRQNRNGSQPHRAFAYSPHSKLLGPYPAYPYIVKSGSGGTYSFPYIVEGGSENVNNFPQQNFFFPTYCIIFVLSN